MRPPYVVIKDWRKLIIMKFVWPQLI